MAKKRRARSQAAQPRMQNTSSVDIRTFLKGMVKDTNASFQAKESWSHARNAINNSVDGDIATLGNEPANIECGSAPYTIIGAIHLYADQWVIYSTDDTNSEIGRFDDSMCKYQTIVNAPCLNFNRNYLIQGAAKENFDCTWSTYWDDGNNPSRVLNIDNVPWKQIVTSGNDPCVIYEDTTELDCEKIRLAPLLDTPCVSLSKAESGGQLRNGMYQAFIAYTVNEQKVTDYIGISNLQSLFDHLGTSGGLSINVSNLDKEFDFYELVILSNNQEAQVAKRIGLYSTETQFIEVDYIDPSLVTVPLELIPLRNPAYEKSDAMFVVNDYLIRKGPYEQFDFNYQPLANKIKAKWTIVEYESDYYLKGGNKTGLMRDEQYAFFIRWIYNTGERSSSYHIPGRAPRANGFTQFQQPINETGSAAGNLNALSTDEKNWQVYNTAQKLQTTNVSLADGGVLIANGDMGYWESTEKYNPIRPDIWEDLCGLPIRHHKMPTEETADEVRLTNPDATKIRILGVAFEDIQAPVNNDGNLIENIVGYEILRGSREGQRSILAKGLLRNMREYDIPEGGQTTGTGSKGLYPNYPYNDLRPDTYFHDGNSNYRTDGQHNYTQSKGAFAPLTGYKKDVFTFHAPDLMFRKPFLNAYETRIYGELSGEANGYFVKSENHPQNKLIRNGAALIAGLVGVGYAISAVKGQESYEFTGLSNGMSGVFPDLLVGFASSVPGSGYLTSVGASAAGAGVAVAKNAVGAALINELLSDLTSIASLYSGGGFANKINLQVQNIANNGFASIPGVDSGQYNTKYEIKNPTGALPTVINVFLSAIIARTNIAIGAQEIIDLFYNMVKEQDFAFKHNSHGFYYEFKRLLDSQQYRTKTMNANYVGGSFQEFNGYKINNLFRPLTVALATEDEVDIPTVVDKSRYQIGGDADSDTGDTYLRRPGQERKRNISALYAGIKFEFENQYGQLDGIKQIHMRGCIELIEPVSTQQKFDSQPIFSGDTYVGRFTEKTVMPIFTDFLNGQPNEFAYDYLKRVNIPYPRFWMDTRKFDTAELASEIITLGLTNSDNAMPNDLFYLDRGTNSTASGLQAVFGNGSDPNHAFAMTYAYMYTHVNGVQDFYVESEYNLAQRDWGDNSYERHYDEFTFTDKDEMFHADHIKKGNLYKYDLSLSPSKFVTQVVSFGSVQPRDYDPYVAENCYQYYPKRLLYSLQAKLEAKKDFWRVFLPNNYKDFKSKVNVIKPISKTGALILFPYQSPKMLQGVDTLQTDMGTKLTVGDGGLFNQPFQNIVNSDLSNEYGSSESARGVVNTPMGVFFVSQAQGKIFHYTGKLENIANNGMKQWFNKYLPSILIRQFPELEQSPLSDNPIKGVGCQTIYDPNYDIVYFTKTDYKLREGYLCDDGKGGYDPFRTRGPQGGCVEFNTITNSFVYFPETGGEIEIEIGDPVFFQQASWTVSYDPKTRAWISFHDWHPELVIPSINHFFTTKTRLSDGTGGIWRHNATCAQYVNYYGKDYPWEVEIIENTGNNVNTLRSVEYMLESYVYGGDLINGCADDRWHDLDFNFDEAIIHNTEQVSGLLKLDLSPKNDPFAMVQYPVIGFNDMRILYSKEEQKYRFNQFWDMTMDRGEFSTVQQNIFITQVNGYIRDLNSANLNYAKEETQHKRFRHYYNKVLLRRKISGDRKMLLKLATTKLNLSIR